MTNAPFNTSDTIVSVFFQTANHVLIGSNGS